MKLDQPPPHRPFRMISTPAGRAAAYRWSSSERPEPPLVEQRAKRAISRDPRPPQVSRQDFVLPQPADDRRTGGRAASDQSRSPQVSRQDFVLPQPAGERRTDQPAGKRRTTG